MSLGLKFLLLLGILTGPAYQELAFQKKGRQFYVCMEDLTPESIGYLKNNGIPVTKIIYQNFIDPDQDNKVNMDVFQKRIQTLFPQKSSTGMGVIDWEVRDFDRLPDNSAKFSQLVNEYRKAVLAAKKLRPNVKWGFYGLPFRKYMSYNADWRNRNIKLTPILKECDFIAPSLYGFFPDSLRDKDNQDYVTNNVSIALQLGSQLDKPVYPFVWNRWHDSNKQYGLQLIPVQEFKRHVKRILAVDYNGQKVAGVIWWGADKFFYNRKAPALMRERARFRNFDSYQNNTTVVYAQALQDIFPVSVK